MKHVLIMMPLLLGSFDESGQQPAPFASDPVRAALEAQYAKISTAYGDDAPETILDLRTPDFEVQMPNGERWDAARSAAHIRTAFQQVERTLDLAFTIVEVDVRGDTAAAWIHQRWSREQRMQGRLRRVETSACQRETWIRTGEGWRHRLIDRIQPLVWKVDGKRVDPSKPFDPQAPPYAPDVEPKSVCTEEARTAYARLLTRHVGPGTIDGVRLNVVDYAAIRRDPDLRAALDELASARPAAMSREERLAFWINAYNLLAIRLVADAYPIESILAVKSGDQSVWDRAAGTAAGRVVSLGEIEGEILRRQFREPRIHFALVAAAVSCPDLRREPYDGARLDQQLDEAARAFLADEHRGVRRMGREVQVSQLLHGFHKDFEPRGVVAFIRAHAPARVASWLEGLDRHDLGKIPYEWDLNDRARSSVAEWKLRSSRDETRLTK